MVVCMNDSTPHDSVHRCQHTEQGKQVCRTSCRGKASKVELIFSRLPSLKVLQLHFHPELLQVSKLLHYSPVTRVTAIGALTHPFFDELRDPNTTLPNGQSFCLLLP